jgi:hypothetical protein
MLSYITGHNVDFTYLNGYVYHMPFEEGASYIGMELHYTSKANNDVECENSYTDYITVGEETLEFSYYVKHSYTQTVIAPTVSDGGYTIYTCLACGDEYKSDFTDKLGTDVYGYVKIMSNLNGDIIENSFVPYTPIYNNEGKLVATTDENGYFEVNDAYDYLIIASQGGPSRKINIVKDNADLGDIGVVYCDFNGDNYVNAKDFGLLRKWFGKYDEDDVVSKSLDINQNGELDFDDWEYASSFFAYGKLNESIYDY